MQGKLKFEILTTMKPIKTALISVYHKDGLENILHLLHEGGVKFLSTGGTRRFIQEQGYECAAVEDLTGYPSIFGGRVKTLHPKVFGGILQRREVEDDHKQAQEHDIPEIDLVVVDLYPFEQTVASGCTEAEAIEKIDIGGISLIRAAAKNFKDVVIVASKGQYHMLEDMLHRNGCQSDEAERRLFATHAFAVSSGYDTAIYNYFGGEMPGDLRLAVNSSMPLRYGENPHQKGVFYGDFHKLFDQLHGKEISYNNLGDIDAAVKLLSEFEKPTFCILKHQNACGVASRDSILEAWTAALACDPLSAFGGVLASNRLIDTETAQEVNKIFCEVVIAPDYTEDALKILESKKNRIILLQKEPLRQGKTVKSALNGVLVQEADTENEKEMKTVTKAAVRDEKVEDLLFANRIVKHSKSNAIVIAKDETLCASGVGQTSRVDALKHAIDKARSFKHDITDAVVASDAFFPFSDCVQTASDAGIKTFIQPGGSIRDGESIELCDALGCAMIFTGTRHFKH